MSMSAHAQSGEPAAEPAEGSTDTAAHGHEHRVVLGDVGDWSVAAGFEVSRRTVHGPDGEVTLVTVEPLNENAEVAAGSFLTLSVYPEGITMQGARLDAESALRLTVDSIAASTATGSVEAAASECRLGGQDGRCTEFNIPSAGGELQVDARAVVVGDSLVTTVLVRSPEADAGLDALLGDALRLQAP
jgi:hypothetical protein